MCILCLKEGVYPTDSNAVSTLPIIRTILRHSNINNEIVTYCHWKNRLKLEPALVLLIFLPIGLSLSSILPIVTNSKANYNVDIWILEALDSKLDKNQATVIVNAFIDMEVEYYYTLNKIKNVLLNILNFADLYIKAKNESIIIQTIRLSGPTNWLTFGLDTWRKFYSRIAHWLTSSILPIVRFVHSMYIKSNINNTDNMKSITEDMETSPHTLRNTDIVSTNWSPYIQRLLYTVCDMIILHTIMNSSYVNLSSVDSYPIWWVKRSYLEGTLREVDSWIPIVLPIPYPAYIYTNSKDSFMHSQLSMTGTILKWDFDRLISILPVHQQVQYICKPCKICR